MQRRCSHLHRLLDQRRNNALRVHLRGRVSRHHGLAVARAHPSHFRCPHLSHGRAGNRSMWTRRRWRSQSRTWYAVWLTSVVLFLDLCNALSVHVDVTMVVQQGCEVPMIKILRTEQGDNATTSEHVQVNDLESHERSQSRTWYAVLSDCSLDVVLAILHGTLSRRCGMAKWYITM